MSSLLQDCMAFGAAVARFSGRRGFEAACLVALSAALEGFGILLLVPMLAILFGQQGAGSPSRLGDWLLWLMPGLSSIERLALILGLFGGLMVLRMLTLWARDLVLGRLQVNFVEAQRVKVARGLASADWPTLAAIGHGRVTHLLGADIQRCGAGVFFLLQSSAAALLLIAQVGLVVILSPPLALFAVGTMALGTLALSGLLRRSRDVGKIVTETSLALTNSMVRFLSGMKVAMSQNLQGAFVARFEQDIGTSVHRQAGFAGQQALLRGMWSLMTAAIAAGTMLVGFGLLHLSAPVLIALLIVLARINAPASQLHLGIQQIAYSLSAWQSVAKMEAELATAAVPPTDAVPSPRLRGDIRFEGVGYRHKGDEGWGLVDVYLNLGAGEMVGLSGASGAGKTTLADLLVSLIMPQLGQISVGATPLTRANARQWREQVAYVAQDPVMFNDSVRANLSWANPMAGDAEIATALAVAGADRWVASLAHGLDTMVGEGGALISGGERQRLALARALLRAPNLLVLDEATSAIDVESEAGILARLRAFEPRITILLIAHRNESLAFCDRVFVLEEGRLAVSRQRARETSPARMGRRT